MASLVCNEGSIHFNKLPPSACAADLYTDGSSSQKILYFTCTNSFEKHLTGHLDQGSRKQWICLLRH